MEKGAEDWEFEEAKLKEKELDLANTDIYAATLFLAFSLFSFWCEQKWHNNVLKDLEQDVYLC